MSIARRPRIACATRRNLTVTAPWRIAVPHHVPKRRVCVCLSTPRAPITAPAPIQRSRRLIAGTFAWRFVIHRAIADQAMRASISRKTTFGPLASFPTNRAAIGCACWRNRTRRSIRIVLTISAKSIVAELAERANEVAGRFGRLQLRLLRAVCVWSAAATAHAACL